MQKKSIKNDGKEEAMTWKRHRMQPEDGIHQQRSDRHVIKHQWPIDICRAQHPKTQTSKCSKNENVGIRILENVFYSVYTHFVTENI
jgi:hypothetical protein